MAGTDITSNISIPNPKLALDTSHTQTTTQNQQGATILTGLSFGNYQPVPAQVVMNPGVQPQSFSIEGHSTTFWAIVIGGGAFVLLIVVGLLRRLWA